MSRKKPSLSTKIGKQSDAVKSGDSAARWFRETDERLKRLNVKIDELFRNLEIMSRKYEKLSDLDRS